MSQKSLGIIETVGLSAAVEAADTALKSAAVELVGYELTKGSGMTVVKVEGNVGAVKAAMDAAAMAVSRMGTVVSVKVIPRPSQQIEILVRNAETVGWEEQELQTKELPTKELRTEELQAGESQIMEFQTEKLQIEESQIREAQIVEPRPKEFQIEESQSAELRPEKLQIEESQIQEAQIVEPQTQEAQTEELQTEEPGIEEPDAPETPEQWAADSAPEGYTCNLCKDPNCPRQKGDLKQMCIHYRKKK